MNEIRQEDFDKQQAKFQSKSKKVLTDFPWQINHLAEKDTDWLAHNW